MQPLVEVEGVITKLGTFTLLLDVSSRRRQKTMEICTTHPSVCTPPLPFLLCPAMFDLYLYYTPKVAYLGKTHRYLVTPRSTTSLPN